MGFSHLVYRQCQHQWPKVLSWLIMAVVKPTADWMWPTDLWGCFTWSAFKQVSLRAFGTCGVVIWYIRARPFVKIMTRMIHNNILQWMDLQWQSRNIHAFLRPCSSVSLLVKVPSCCHVNLQSYTHTCPGVNSNEHSLASANRGLGKCHSSVPSFPVKDFQAESDATLESWVDNSNLGGSMVWFCARKLHYMCTRFTLIYFLLMLIFPLKIIKYCISFFLKLIEPWQQSRCKIILIFAWLSSWPDLF